jgi:UDPglucose--hexose-1-phosphate uridylyltransferase
MDYFQTSHRRKNLLTGRWILCSPHRTTRPWLGQVESSTSSHSSTRHVQDTRIIYAPDCYLCPGNLRQNGIRNPDYTSTFVFDNDFPALSKEIPSSQDEKVHHEQSQIDEHHNTSAPTRRKMMVHQSVRGICKVICFSPRHDVTLTELTNEEIKTILLTWRMEIEYLRIAHPYLKYIQIFENKGPIMGCSNPHPHCQLWAIDYIPQELDDELIQFTEWNRQHGTCLLCDYVQQESLEKIRILMENEHFICLLPYWALWPFETMIISRDHSETLEQLTDPQLDSLADLMRRLSIKYDRLFDCSFPYSMGLHQAPLRRDPPHSSMFHLHFHYYPPLLRSAHIKKFLVGFEMLAEAQRDLTVEIAAERLRNIPDGDNDDSVS